MAKPNLPLEALADGQIRTNIGTTHDCKHVVENGGSRVGIMGRRRGGTRSQEAIGMLAVRTRKPFSKLPDGSNPSRSTA